MSHPGEYEEPRFSGMNRKHRDSFLASFLSMSSSKKLHFCSFCIQYPTKIQENLIPVGNKASGMVIMRRVVDTQRRLVLVFVRKFHHF